MGTSKKTAQSLKTKFTIFHAAAIDPFLIRALQCKHPKSNHIRTGIADEPEALSKPAREHKLESDTNGAASGPPAASPPQDSAPPSPATALPGAREREGSEGRAGPRGTRRQGEKRGGGAWRK